MFLLLFISMNHQQVNARLKYRTIRTNGRVGSMDEYCVYRSVKECGYQFKIFGRVYPNCIWRNKKQCYG